MMADNLMRPMNSNAAQFDKRTVLQKDDLQRALIDALAGVLKVKPTEIDIAKNFDEYGLDSIDAVIATEWIGNRLGIVLPPEFLLLFRSIDAVTKALLAGKHRQSASYIPPYTQTPIFLFPGAGGADEPALIRFREKATSHLRFEVVHVDKWHHWIDQGFNFEDLAARAAQYVNGKSPQGRIRLAGYSQGGQLAYVTGLALENMGRSVELVCLLDTSTDVIYRTSDAKSGIFLGALTLCRDYITTKIHGRTLFPRGRKWIHFISWLWDKRGGPEIVMMVVRFGRAVLPGRARIRGDTFIQMRVFAKMWGDWTEKNKNHILHNTPVVLFRSEEPGSPDLGWRAYCPDITIVPVSGDHYSMLTSEGLVGQFISEVGRFEPL